jgi:hypothetical protein
LAEYSFFDVDPAQFSDPADDVFRAFPGIFFRLPLRGNRFGQIFL